RGLVAARTSSRRRPKPASPSKPAKPSKPHTPVVSRSARLSTVRVSGVGVVVCAKVGGTGRSKFAASIPVAIHVEKVVFVIPLTFLSLSESACALGDTHIKPYGTQE